MERRRRFTRCAYLGLGWALTAWTGAVTPAQPPPRREPDAFVNQQRALQERLDAQRDTELGVAGRLDFDFGGWVSQHIFLFDDGVKSSRTFRRSDLRFWGRVRLDDGAHEFYARARLGLADFNTGDSYDGDDDDVEGPNLERGYYQLDLLRALGARGDGPATGNLTVKVGRDLAWIGTGLTLATPLDHVWVQGRGDDWELAALWGRTVGSGRDFDLARTAKRTRRSFLGGQIRYRGLQRHTPFVYALWQRDHNDEHRASLLQRFDYDSHYVGVGSTGELRPGLRYQAELVYAGGRSFGHGQFLRRSHIRAWAMDVELEYLFSGPHQARASIEYLFGSGDAGRRTSPTDSAGGNRGDRTDTGFIGFGYRDTGLSFAPRPANVHILRVGASCFPAPRDRRFQRLEVGTDWYLYHKHQRRGAISDPTATLSSGYLGWEMDYYANWELTADLAGTARFGAFVPGAAFRDRTLRTFLLVGLTWSF